MSVMTEDQRREHAKRALTVFKGMIETVYEPLLSGHREQEAESPASLPNQCY